MKILLDCEELKHPHTGLYTFCTDLSEAMMDTISEEDRLSFFVGKDKTKFFGDKYKHHRRNLWHKIVPFIFVPGLDIWHTTFQLSKYSGGTKNTKKVMTVHDLNFMHETIALTDFSSFLCQYQQSIDAADHIVAISEFAKNDILRYMDLKGKPISVIHNGYNVREFPDFDTPDYRPNRPFLFAMGAVNRKKNFKSLPPLLRDNDYELIIAGRLCFDVELDYKNEIVTEAEKYGVSDRIKFLGTVSNEEKYWYLKNCDALLFPSFAEGFGLPVLEAMHFGKPTFVSTLTALPEIAGEYGYYFQNFDPEHMTEVFKKSMIQFANDPNRAQELINYTKKFSYEKAAREYYEVYKSLM